jgi:acyl-CoA thioesterase
LAHHEFDAAIELASAGEHRFSGATSPAYANMVGPFGGITNAVLMNAVLMHPQRQGDPIALTVNFAGPVADGAFEIEARPVRTNRSTQHWTLQLTQQGSVAATATAVFALRRDTWSRGEALAPQGMPPVSALPRAATSGRPAWAQRYDMRFDEGELAVPFDGQEQPHSVSRLWVRDEPPRPLDYASLAAICDSFFPRIFIRRRAPSPVGTVTLTTFFHADSVMLAEQGDRHVLGTARALNYRNSYFDQSAEIWSDGGQLLASTHQMVYFRE